MLHVHPRTLEGLYVIVEEVSCLWGRVWSFASDPRRTWLVLEMTSIAHVSSVTNVLSEALSRFSQM